MDICLAVLAGKMSQIEDKMATRKKYVLNLHDGHLGIQYGHHIVFQDININIP